MADRINIADKETLDLAVTRLTSAMSNLQDILSKIGTNEDTSVETLFGLAKLTSVAAGSSIIKAIYRGSSSISSIGTSVTHPSVNLDKSIVIFNATPTGSATGINVAMTNRTSTSVTFSASSPAALTWQVIEFN